MADEKRRIYNHYEKEGYLRVPGYYNAEHKDYHCKICKWQNTSGRSSACCNCGSRYREAHTANEKICGIPVRLLSPEEWQVFEAIARQMLANETPFATLEEYAEECAERIKETEERRKTTKTDEQRINAILYGHY